CSAQPSPRPETQTPPAQKSPAVQAEASSQPSVSSGTLLQAPDGAHASRVQGLPSSQVSPPGRQIPEVQRSPAVHGSPSSQKARLDRCTQPTSARQVSSVQTLSSSQTSGAVGRHWPSTQRSPSVHR